MGGGVESKSEDMKCNVKELEAWQIVFLQGDRMNSGTAAYGEMVTPSMCSHIPNVHVYSCHPSTIKLFTTHSLYAVNPIHHAPLTCLMNFLSSTNDDLCLVPQLTLRSLSR